MAGCRAPDPIDAIMAMAGNITTLTPILFRQGVIGGFCELSNRPQDLLDIAALREALNEQSDPTHAKR